jgi:hypothetical protein
MLPETLERVGFNPPFDFLPPLARNIANRFIKGCKGIDTEEVYFEEKAT